MKVQVHTINEESDPRYRVGGLGGVQFDDYNTAVSVARHIEQVYQQGKEARSQEIGRLLGVNVQVHPAFCCNYPDPPDR